MKLTYDSPAKRWQEANPLGNGHMGAMIYGSFPAERIDLSELTFFSGEASHEENHQEGASEAFYEMRKQLESDDYLSARKTAEKFIGIRRQYGTNLPVGTLEYTIQNISAQDKKPTDYIRTLDLETGIWNNNIENKAIGRQCFLSWPDKVLVYTIESKEEISLMLSYKNYGEGKIEYQANGIYFETQALEKIHSDGSCGTKLVGRCELQTDGRVSVTPGGIQISGCRQLTIYLSMLTDFEGPIKYEELEQSMKHAAAQGVKKLCQRHCADFASYMNRVYLELKSSREGEENEAASMFQYGRYLLLSSSREDSRVPAHLQGIWNDNVACRIGWTCDMHLDINTQMNYWPAEVTNLTETVEPLFQWIEQKLMPAGRICAQKSYGLSGWIAELVSNAWGFSAPYWAAPIAPCPTGGVWILSHMWEHEYYEHNEIFLRTRLYPAVKEAVIFFSSYVFIDKLGRLSSGPSISPENSFLFEQEELQISNGCTYELLMIKELYAVYVELEKMLMQDKMLLEKVEKQLHQLECYRILEDGTIAEWSHSFRAADLQHRHTSHLLGLFPFAQITPEGTPELAQAAAATIEQRLTPLDGFEDTGWARSMLLLYSARLQDGNKALSHIRSLLHTLKETNHFIIHPPTRGAGSFANVYELDGNTGFTSGIAEMLLQSHNGVIRLLPALPDEWHCGTAAGLRARGGITVEMQWEKGELTHLKLKGKPGSCYHAVWKMFCFEGRLPEGGEIVLR